MSRIELVGSVTHLKSIGALERNVRDGAWWTLRLQILPDGRCGVAIDGRVVWISPERLPLDEVYWLRLGDENRSPPPSKSCAS